MTFAHCGTRMLFLCLLFLVASIQALSQCCPDSTDCGVCSGGLTSITLRYNGASRALITVDESLGSTVYNDSVSSGGIFSFSGTTILTGLFLGNVNIFVNGDSEVTIGTSCANVPNIGDDIGDFTFMAAESLGGTALCCSSGDGDTTAPVITGCPSNLVESANGSCKAIVNWTPPTATDNCSVPDLSSNFTPGAEFPLGITTVTYIATDESGNSDTCSFTVTVVDETAPVISGCPADVIVTANNSCKATASWTAPTADDNCSSAVDLTSNFNPGDEFPVGTTTVTYIATDSEGNADTCSFTVTVVDETAPVISGCPEDLIVIANSSCKATASWTAPTADDNCAFTMTSTHSPGDEFVAGTTTVTYTATDASGNISTCSFDVIVKDATAPVISQCPVPVSVDADRGACTAPVTWTPPEATDNCAVLMTASHNSGDEFPVGTTLVKYTASDDAGNTSVCSFEVTVLDVTTPELSDCPSNRTASANGECESVVTWVPPSATDNCSVTLTSSHNPGDKFAIGTTTVTYTAIDEAGNTSSCSFDVTIHDLTPPAISTCPLPVTVNANDACKAIVSWDPPTASDNCSVTLTSDYVPGDEFEFGKTTVTYTATDQAGNTSACSFEVTVKDVTSPVISACPTSFTVNANAACKAIVTWEAPTISDNCNVVVTSNYNPGDEFPLGITTVIYTATDDGGNKATCSFEVEVIDNTPPLIFNCPTDITVIANENCAAIVNWTAPEAFDNCAVTMTSDYQPGNIFPIGVTEVTYTAVDGNGAVATCAFKVTVEDRTIPVFHNCVTEIGATADATCQAVVTWDAPQVFDNCGIAALTNSHNSGDLFPVGITEVEYKATDVHGNIAVCVFNVHVRNAVPPLISGCPADIFAKAGESGELMIDWPEPTAVAACGSVSMTRSHSPNGIFSVGSTTVQYVARDEAGDESVCMFKIVITYEELKFDISKVVTPDGDGLNDAWLLSNIEKFRDNRVTIIDRWGNVIYTASGYDNESVVWTGLNANGVPVPTGTYFYAITVQFRSEMVDKRGFIELVR